MPTPELHEFLPDPSGNTSQVFIRVRQPTDVVASVKDAMQYLSEREPKPLQFSISQWGGNLTVIVAASQYPRIEFGRSAPTGKPDDDLVEILSVLRGLGIEAICPRN